MMLKNLNGEGSPIEGKGKLIKWKEKDATYAK
jgi:hypothetical protein